MTRGIKEFFLLSCNGSLLTQCRFSPELISAVFTAGILFCLLSQCILVYLPDFKRSEPYEVDDAYVYISSAAQMEQGFFLQDCESLNDLRDQYDWRTVNDKDIEWYRYVYYFRTFIIYHPGHSLAMLLPKGLGFDWKTSYKIIRVLGSFLIIFSIAWLLRILWGKMAAGLALMFLSLMIFPGQGLHAVVPGNMSLGMGFLLIAYIIDRKKINPLIFYFLIAATISLHTGGKLYVMAALSIFFLTKPLSLRNLLLFMTGFALLGLSFLLPSIVTSPELRILKNPLPEGFSYWTGFFKIVGIVLKKSVTLEYMWFLFVLPISIIFAGLKKKRAVTVVSFILFGLFCASFFYVLPHAWGNITLRFSIPIGIIATGGFFYLLLTVFAYFSLKKAKLIRFLQKYKVVAIGLALLFCVLCSFYLYRKGKDVYVTSKSQINKSNISFNQDQPQFLLENMKYPDKVLYLGPSTMLYFLSKGLYKYGAIDYYAVAGTSLDDKIHDENIAYLVMRTPVFSKENRNDNILLLAGDTSRVRFEQPFKDKIVITFENEKSRTGEVKIAVNNEKPGVYEIIKKGQTYIEIPSGNDILTVTIKADIPVKVKGISRKARSRLRWLWTEKMTVSVSPVSGEPFTIAFDEGQIVPGELKRKVQIVDDRGLAVIGKIAE